MEKTGTVALQSRATDSAGNVQPLEHTWNPPGYLRNAVDKIEIEVSKQNFVAEENLLEARCLTCHTRELISSQRLSEEAWAKTVTKMEGFGVKLEADERNRLVKYLARWSPELVQELPVPTSFWAEDAQLESRQYPKGVASRGHRLFTQSCASCHGGKGEGLTAPRLAGREIPLPYFWAVVGGGKADMPAFGETLKRQDVADIEGFLRTQK